MEEKLVKVQPWPALALPPLFSADRPRCTACDLRAGWHYAKCKCVHFSQGDSRLHAIFHWERNTLLKGAEAGFRKRERKTKPECSHGHASHLILDQWCTCKEKWAAQYTTAVQINRVRCVFQFNRGILQRALLSNQISLQFNGADKFCCFAPWIIVPSGKSNLRQQFRSFYSDDQMVRFHPVTSFLINWFPI